MIILYSLEWLKQRNLTDRPDLQNSKSERDSAQQDKSLVAHEMVKFYRKKKLNYSDIGNKFCQFFLSAN